MIKAFFEVYKILNKIGIKPKDVIGMGGNIVKMGKSLFNTRINPKLITFIEKNQKIPPKILEEIKLHARTLKNATQHQKYRLNPSRQSLASIDQDQAARNFQHGLKDGNQQSLKVAKTV